MRSDLDTLLLPLLKLLYEATRREPSHMYMLLVILLILSQDAAFAAAAHEARSALVPRNDMLNVIYHSLTTRRV